MIRFQDWRSRLGAEITKRMNAGFYYGRHDCCMSASACIEAMTGVNFIKDEFGSYRGKEASEDKLKKHGGIVKMVESFATKYSLKEVPNTRAQAGDLVLCETEEGPALGIVELSARTFVIASKVGWVPKSVSEAIRIWRV